MIQQYIEFSMKQNAFMLIKEYFLLNDLIVAFDQKNNILKI